MTAHACNFCVRSSDLLQSRDLSREFHVTKHKTPARSNFPLSNFKNSGTI